MGVMSKIPPAKPEEFYYLEKINFSEKLEDALLKSYISNNSSVRLLIVNNICLYIKEKNGKLIKSMKKGY